MKIANTDIDIDTHDRDRLLKILGGVPASMSRDGKVGAHNTGVYFHKVPTDPFSGLCSFDYKKSEEIGYFKIDVLNVHIVQLTSTPPMWQLLEEKDFCDLVFHVSGHHGLCQQMKPDTVEKLAAVLAMIRPAKRHLIGEPWDKVFAEIWKKPNAGEYYFKKAHAISYAMATIAHMNLLVEQLN
jgi:DNA polymerase III alpha subunit